MTVRNVLMAGVVAVCVGFALGSAAAQQVRNVEVWVDPAAPVADETLHYPTIQRALDHAPEPAGSGRLVIHIAPGTYRERVYVSMLRARTTLLGEGRTPADVVITAAQYAKFAGGTFFTETVKVDAAEFAADNVTFENSAGPVGQAVAVFVSADKAIFKHCRFLGDQDTLLAGAGRQLYVDSYISGGVDFIFGNATAVFERGELHIVRPGYLTAQSRTSPRQSTGFVFDHVRVTAGELGGKPFYLGRPWRQYARVVFLHAELPAALSPEGWAAWPQNTPDVRTPFFAEFDSEGPGARPGERVAWSRQLTAKEAAAFAPAAFLAGSDGWNAEVEAARLP